ncbi:response regulator transcription factor [Myroides sp. C4067]|uniref:response regulator transcription factor n=1 Tax=Myroides sp. C4067 TaxID=3136765 RepID=UPI003101A9F2
MIRIAIVDDHRLFRQNFSNVFSKIEDIEVLFDCSNGIELLEKLKRISVDIVFLDISMPIMDGYQVASLLEKNHPNVKVFILTSFCDGRSIKRMLKYNISGYLTKNISFSKLKEAIYCVYTNGVYYDIEIQDTVSKVKEQKDSEEVVFTTKEIELIKLYAMQFTLSEIADKLNLSPRTIEKMKENLMDRTGSSNFIGVILYALRWHYIEDIDEKENKERKTR